MDVDAAKRVLDEKIGEPLGWSTRQAAAAVYDLAAIEMANALRVVSIERGFHPRDFTFFSYGGGLGLFAVEICRRLGVPNIVIPDNSSAFSAYGVLIADYVRQYDRTVNWDLSDPSQADRVNGIMHEMLEQAVADAEIEGLEAGSLSIERTGDLRFVGQTYEVSVPLEDRDFTAADAPRLEADFPAIYERNYGEGTAWEGSAVQLLTISLRVVFRREKPLEREQPVRGYSSDPEPKSHRTVFLPIEKMETRLPVFAEADLPPGVSLEGPVIIDVGDTTIYVPNGSTATRDHYFNFILTV
jgi:N-methylhydantoinase A